MEFEHIKSWRADCVSFIGGLVYIKSTVQAAFTLQRTRAVQNITERIEELDP